MDAQEEGLIAPLKRQAAYRQRRHQSSPNESPYSPVFRWMAPGRKVNPSVTSEFHQEFQRSDSYDIGQ